MHKCMLLMAVVIAATCGVSFADDVSGDDNFFSSTLSSVVDKVNKYTSGEKGLLTPDDNDFRRRSDYGQDGLGRKLSEPVIIKTRITPSKMSPDSEESR